MPRHRQELAAHAGRSRSRGADGWPGSSGTPAAPRTPRRPRTGRAAARGPGRTSADDRRDDEAGAGRVGRQAAEHLDAARRRARSPPAPRAARWRPRRRPRARPGRPGKLIWLGVVGAGGRCAGSAAPSARRAGPAGSAPTRAPAARSPSALDVISGSHGRRDEARAQRLGCSARRDGGRCESTPTTRHASRIEAAARSRAARDRRLRGMSNVPRRSWPLAPAASGRGCARQPRPVRPASP